MDPYIGEIRMFAGDFAPVDWLLCDGKTYQIGRYQELYALIQNYYGGDGSSTFAVPDLRGRAPVCVGQAPDSSYYGLGKKVGSEKIILSQQQLPSHNHGVNAVVLGTQPVPGPTNYPSAVPVDPSTGQGVNTYSDATPNVQLNPGTIAATGDNAPVQIVQPVLGLTFIIATKGIWPPRP